VREDGGRLTLFLGELVEQARLPHTHVTNDDVLKDEAVIVRCGPVHLKKNQ
jgi:hypothetical protein